MEKFNLNKFNELPDDLSLHIIDYLWYCSFCNVYGINRDEHYPCSYGNCLSMCKIQDKENWFYRCKCERNHNYFNLLILILLFMVVTMIITS